MKQDLNAIWAPINYQTFTLESQFVRFISNFPPSRYFDRIGNVKAELHSIGLAEQGELVIYHDFVIPGWFGYEVHPIRSNFRNGAVRIVNTLPTLRLSQAMLRLRREQGHMASLVQW